jgi:uncharacterized protein (TIGR03000 family)
MRSLLLSSVLVVTAMGFLATWPSHASAGPFFRARWQRGWWGGRLGYPLLASYYYRTAAYNYPYADYPYADYRTPPGFSTAQEAEPPHPTGGTVAPADAGHIRLLVPDRFATVSFDGRIVSSVGAARDYGTPRLEQGHTYHYMVQVSWGRGDHQMTQERAVDIARGQSVTVDFTSGVNAGHK